MAQVAHYRMADAPEEADARRFLPPPGIHPNGAVFGGVALPKPLTWQRREHLVQRRIILGRIGALLKRNAEIVMGSAGAGGSSATSPMAHQRDEQAHAKTWALARKLEVLIFLNSASLLEYCNVDSLARRVQALTTSIVNKKIRRESGTGDQGAARSAAAMRQRGAGAPTTSTSPAPTAPTSISTPPTPIPAPTPTPPTPTAPTPALSYPPQHQPFAPQSSQSLQQQRSPLAPRLPSPTGLPRAPPFTQSPAHAVGASSMPLASPSSSLDGGSAAVSAKRTANTAFDLPMDRIPLTMATTTATAKRARHGTTELGALLFQGVDELSKLVWSFVEGTQILRCRAVCRVGCALAPQLVTSLTLSCNAMHCALTMPARAGQTSAETSGLRACVNLQALEVVSLSSGMAFGKLSMRAMNCPQRFVVTHDDHERIVLALAQLLRAGVFRRLTRLGLTCLFTNEEADGEADVLLHALMSGCCPELRELCLPGNSFGDYGAIKVAQMLRARVCPQLTRLDLRRNFIAEEGLRSLCHALADGCAPQLRELCLGGNTVTDSCFHHVLFAMESRQLMELRFLGIEMNYLTATSMEMLGRTIGKMVIPQLTQISYSDNSVDNAEAKRRIATAVYQERTFRMRQPSHQKQQQRQQPQQHQLQHHHQYHPHHQQDHHHQQQQQQHLQHQQQQRPRVRYAPYPSPHESQGPPQQAIGMDPEPAVAMDRGVGVGMNMNMDMDMGAGIGGGPGMGVGAGMGVGMSMGMGMSVGMERTMPTGEIDRQLLQPGQAQRQEEDDDQDFWSSDSDDGSDDDSIGGAPMNQQAPATEWDGAARSTSRFW